MATYTLTYLPLPFSEHVTVTTDEGTRKLRRDEEWTRSGRVVTVLDAGDAFSMPGPWRFEVQYAYDYNNSPDEDPPIDLGGTLVASIDGGGYTSNNGDDPLTFGEIDWNNLTYAAGDLFLLATTRSSGYGGGAAVPTGWTQVDADTDGQQVYAIWAPATSSTLLEAANHTVQTGQSPGVTVLLVIRGADLADPIEDYAREGTMLFGEYVTSQTRAAVTCTSQTGVVLNFHWSKEHTSDTIVSTDISTASIGDAVEILTVSADGAQDARFHGIGIGQPGSGAPDWPSAITLLQSGAQGDYHLNVSIAIREG